MRLMKTELRVLFFSPIAWIVLIVFVFQAGMSYCNVLEFDMRNVAMGKNAYNLTYYLVCGYGGVYAKMLESLYLYIPMLTMGVMSRELSSGSIKLLYSSPVSNLQIVLGKYLAMVAYSLILILLLLIPMFFTIFSIKDADIPFMCTGLLGVFLTICSYAAIGVFMSTITKYQVVAAIGTFIILAILNFIGGVGQDISFIRDITYFLAISGRSKVFLEGLICSKDVIYFLLVIFMFLAFTLICLRGERLKKSILKTSMCYWIVFILVLLVGYISSRPKSLIYYDATANKRNTLSEYSQKVIDQLDGKLSLTTYVNLLDDTWSIGLPKMRNIDKGRFDKYVRFIPDLDIKYIYYYGKGTNSHYDDIYKGLSCRERMRKVCEGYGYDSTQFITAEDVNMIDDISAENGRFVRVFNLDKGQKSFLRLYEDNRVHPSEREITTALKTLVDKAPVVAFVAGHGERDCDDFGEKGYGIFATNRTFRYALINQGFQIRKVSLEQSIPTDVDILVISDMKVPLKPGEYMNYCSFLDRGGNIVILGEPGKQANMNLLLEKLGLKFSDGILVSPSKEFSDEIVISSITGKASDVSPSLGAFARKGGKVVSPSACVVEVTDSTKGFKLSPVLISPEKGGWLEHETTDFFNQKSVLNARIGEVEKAYPVMLYLTRSFVERGEQRIFVVGDADCISMKELSGGRAGVECLNFNLVTEMFRCLSYDEYPINTSWARMTDDELYLSLESLVWCKIMLAWVPALFLMVGSITFLIRRKRM